MMSGKLFFNPGKWSVLLLCLALSLTGLRNHEYHVSVTQMLYNPSAKSFEVSIRAFTDDLEKGLSEDNDKRRFTIKNDDKNDQAVEQYIRKSFVFTDSQKKPAAIRYVGKEQEEDATWIYLEIPFQGTLSGCKLQNTTLMEVFEDQVNMTNLKISTEKKTFLFKKGQTTHSL
ncbi:DUF6702 family protein [Dyadobacter luticola]|uniref:DUF6702 family protein n=1 Tax=Dyadobacter luticola TaxID=1979387 RepID=UPI001E2D2BBB|nr:DUF6702 family protein [Dyadobacter luticola]